MRTNPSYSPDTPFFPAIMATSVCVILLGGSTLTGSAADYHVDSEDGDDRNPGTATATAWKSLDRVNDADLKGGDRVLFKKGRAWRGSLRLRSGTAEAPIFYMSYGESTAQPTLRQSVSLSAPKDWIPAGKNLWKTRPDAIDPTTRMESATFATKRWSIYCEGDGRAELETKPATDKGLHYRLTCVKAGRATNQIQFSNSSFPLQERTLVTYTFRARASKPFSTQNIRLMQSQSPWTRYGTVGLKGSNDTTLSFGNEWQEYNLEFRPSKTADDGRVTFLLGTDIPEGGVFEFIPLGASSNRVDSLGLDADVGNLILADAAGRESVGWKRWNLAELKHPGDFYSDPCAPDPGPRTITMYSERNPAEQHGAIEAAIRHNIKQLDITYRNNLFCRTKDAFIWYFNGRLPDISGCDGNVYQQGGSSLESMPLFRWNGQPEAGLTFGQYRQKTGFDQNSRLEPAPVSH